MGNSVLKGPFFISIPKYKLDSLVILRTRAIGYFIHSNPVISKTHSANQRLIGGKRVIDSELARERGGGWRLDLDGLLCGLRPPRSRSWPRSRGPSRLLSRSRRRCRSRLPSRSRLCCLPTGTGMPERPPGFF